MGLRVIVAGNFGRDERRIEVGDILTDVDPVLAKDLLNAGMVVEESAPKKQEPVEAVETSS